MAPHWLLRISHCNSLGIFTNYKSSGRDKNFVYWVPHPGTLEPLQFPDYWKSGVEVFILYPNGKVSPLQERQMTCTGASNVYPIAIEGTLTMPSVQ